MILQLYVIPLPVTILVWSFFFFEILFRLIRGEMFLFERFSVSVMGVSVGVCLRPRSLAADCSRSVRVIGLCMTEKTVSNGPPLHIVAYRIPRL